MPRIREIGLHSKYKSDYKPGALVRVLCQVRIGNHRVTHPTGTITGQQDARLRVSLDRSEVGAFTIFVRPADLELLLPDQDVEYHPGPSDASSEPHSPETMALVPISKAA